MLLKLLVELHERHERLKRFVHEGLRYPLPPWGQNVMKGVYFTIPLIAAFYLLERTLKHIDENTRQRSEELLKYQLNKNKSNNGTESDPEASPNDFIKGNTRIVGDTEQRVGAGGWGGGVRLAVNDPETEKRNQRKIRKYLRKLKQEHEKRQKQQQHQQTENQ
ncbi:hypothetical protein ACA910_021037 [Epithemia clementina (nom. ined.)]